MECPVTGSLREAEVNDEHDRESVAVGMKLVKWSMVFRVGWIQGTGCGAKGQREEQWQEDEVKSQDKEEGTECQLWRKYLY